MRRVELFTITITAGTLITAPTFTACPFDVGDVEAVEIVIPPGPSGLVGFGIMHGGASVWPREESKWIVTDDEKIRWDIDDSPSAGDWTIRAYNLDVFDHSLFFRFLVREVQRTQPPAGQALVIEQPDQPAPEPEPLPDGVYLAELVGL